MVIKKKIDEKESSFEGNPVTIYKDGHRTHLITIPKKIDFFSMIEERKTSVDPQFLERKIYGTGYTFANVGVSVCLTVGVSDDNYLVLVKQNRRDEDDEVLKLISGYVASCQRPEEAIKKELKEELIMVKNGEYLSLDIEEILNNKSAYLTRSIDSDKIILDDYHLDCLGIQYCAPTNSAQLIFGGHVQIENVDGLSLFHAEDVFNQETRKLDVFLTDDLFLAKVKEGGIDGELYKLENGLLKEVTPKEKTSLSEFFVPSKNGIITQKNIYLDSILEK